MDDFLDYIAYTQAYYNFPSLRRGTWPRQEQDINSPPAQETNAAVNNDSVIELLDDTDPGSSSSTAANTATLNNGRNELTTDNVPSSSLSSNALASETLSVGAEVIDLTISPSTNRQLDDNNDDDVIFVGEIGPIRSTNNNRYNRQVQARSIFAYPTNPPVVLAPPNLSASGTAGGTVVETGASANTNSNMQCSVCLDDPLKSEPTSTKCGHVFCGPCIRQALTIRKKCPLCNKACGPRQLVRLYV